MGVLLRGGILGSLSCRLGGRGSLRSCASIYRIYSEERMLIY